jgi:hypothetical protein
MSLLPPIRRCFLRRSVQSGGGNELFFTWSEAIFASIDGSLTSSAYTSGAQFSGQLIQRGPHRRPISSLQERMSWWRPTSSSDALVVGFCAGHA